MPASALFIPMFAAAFVLYADLPSSGSSLFYRYKSNITIEKVLFHRTNLLPQLCSQVEHSSYHLSALPTSFRSELSSESTSIKLHFRWSIASVRKLCVWKVHAQPAQKRRVPRKKLYQFRHRIERKNWGFSSTDTEQSCFDESIAVSRAPFHHDVEHYKCKICQSPLKHYGCLYYLSLQNPFDIQCHVHLDERVWFRRV